MRLAIRAPRRSDTLVSIGFGDTLVGSTLDGSNGSGVVAAKFPPLLTSVLDLSQGSNKRRLPADHKDASQRATLPANNKTGLGFAL